VRPSELLGLHGNPALAFDLTLTQIMATEERKHHTGEFWWVPVSALARAFIKEK